MEAFLPGSEVKVKLQQTNKIDQLSIFFDQFEFQKKIFELCKKENKSCKQFFLIFTYYMTTGFSFKKKFHDKVTCEG